MLKFAVIAVLTYVYIAGNLVATTSDIDNEGYDPVTPSDESIIADDCSDFYSWCSYYVSKVGKTNCNLFAQDLCKLSCTGCTPTTDVIGSERKCQDLDSDCGILATNATRGRGCDKLAIMTVICPQTCGWCPE